MKVIWYNFTPTKKWPHIRNDSLGKKKINQRNNQQVKSKSFRDLQVRWENLLSGQILVADFTNRKEIHAKSFFAVSPKPFRAYSLHTEVVPLKMKDVFLA